MSGAVALLVIALVFLAIDIFSTFRFIRVEQVLGLARDATLAAAKRVRDRQRRLPLAASATLELPIDATALVARESGYIVDVDIPRLARIARRRRVRSRICRPVGDFVANGEIIGWAASDEGRSLGRRLMRDLAATLAVGAARELDQDPALGIRIIVDVADRALSSSVNDPYTARQALNQVRAVLRELGGLSYGDSNVVDPDGSVRVSVVTTHVRDLLTIAVNGPLYYGGEHPEVLEALLEIVLEVCRFARDPRDRAAARQFLERIEALVSTSELDPERQERLRADAEPIRRSLDPERALTERGIS